jgi:hypothetical protein
LLIVHLLVLKQRIKRGKIGRLDRHRRGIGQLLFGSDHLQHLSGADRLAARQEPPQHVVDKIQPFMLGGVQQLEILLDRGSFRRAGTAYEERLRGASWGVDRQAGGPSVRVARRAPHSPQ